MPGYPYDRFRYILATRSPRRQQLFEGMGFSFIIEVREIPEEVPDHLKGPAIAVYLSEAKAAAFAAEEIPEKTIVITADTIVYQDAKMLGKPVDAGDACNILARLSGAMHEVFTAVTLKSRNQQRTFFDRTKVIFRPLSMEQIRFYVDQYKPFDKAGAYGVQEWIGYIAVEEIHGSFYNVMGFPTQKLYPELEAFLLNEMQV